MLYSLKCEGASEFRWRFGNAHLLLRRPQTFEAMQQYFTADETRIFHGLADRGYVRQDWFTARIAMKELAAQRLGGEWRHYWAEADPSGQPRLICCDEPSGLNISLSHANGWGLAGIGTEGLGVDLEPDAPSFLGLHKYIGHEEEFDLLELARRNTQADNSCESMLFSIKEAALKCTGSRLTIPIRQITLSRASPVETNCAGVLFQAYNLENGREITGAAWEHDLFNVCVAVDDRLSVPEVVWIGQRL